MAATGRPSGAEPRGAAANPRVALVTRLVLEVARDAAPVDHPDAPVTVLDCGGGSGTYAVPLAAAGCHVTVLDISGDALATLGRRAAEAGVLDRVVALTGDVERVGELVAPGSFDVVLAHGVLDAVDDVDATFAGLLATARPDGVLSVLVDNPVAAVLSRALGGEPVQALRELRALAHAGPPDGGPTAQAPVGPGTVMRLCARHDVRVVAQHGIGAFSDLVPGAAVDTPAQRQAVAELDAEASGTAPFADIAGRIHLLVRTATDPRGAFGGT